MPGRQGRQGTKFTLSRKAPDKLTVMANNGANNGIYTVSLIGLSFLSAIAGPLS